MVYLRSEDHLNRWLASGGWEPGETISSVKMNEVARTWWSTRLEPGWMPRSAAESQAILERLGLTGEFWSLR